MDEIYNDYAAKKMGIDHTGQVSLRIRTILLWVDTDKVYFLLVTSSWFGYNSVSTLVNAVLYCMYPQNGAIAGRPLEDYLLWHNIILSNYLPVCLLVCLFVCLSVCLSVSYLSVYLSICLSFCMFASILPSTCISISCSPSICQCACLSAYVSIHVSLLLYMTYQCSVKVQVRYI